MTVRLVRRSDRVLELYIISLQATQVIRTRIHTGRERIRDVDRAKTFVTEQYSKFVDNIRFEGPT